MANLYLQRNGVWGSLVNNGTYLVKTGGALMM